MATLVDDALTTVADVKESLGISSGDNSKNNLIIRKINQATSMIKNYTGREFKSATYTEYVDATGTDQIVLRNRPITAITSIGSLSSFDNQDNFDSYQSTDYFFRLGSTDANAGVIDATFNFSGGYDQYKVVYVAGYSATNWPSAVPADLQEAAASLASFLVSNGTSGTNVKIKQEGQRRIEFFDAQTQGNSLFQQLGIDEILDAYSNYPLNVGK